MLYVLVLIGLIFLIGSGGFSVSGIADFFCHSESIEACGKELWSDLKEIWGKLTSGNIFEIISAVISIVMLGLFLFIGLVALAVSFFICLSALSFIIMIIQLASRLLVFSKETATNWTAGLQKYPLIRGLAFCIVFVLVLLLTPVLFVPMGLLSAIYSGMKSSGQTVSRESAKRDDPVKEPVREKKKKNPNRTITGSIVADAMLFDGDSEKARMAKRWRNILGG